MYNHQVCWDRCLQFTCRIAADPVTAILEPCLCRVSVRKEVKGGRSFEKLGFHDVNLSEFAGSGVNGQQQSYLLDAYKTYTRQDNSRLRVNVTMTMLSADPYFKVYVSSSAFMRSRPSANHSTATLPSMAALNPADRRAPSRAPTDDDDESEKTDADPASGKQQQPQEADGRSTPASVSDSDVIVRQRRGLTDAESGEVAEVHK